MKRIVSITILLLVTLIVNAQEDLIPMNRNFNLSGKCVLFSKTRLPRAEDKCDLRWELHNNVSLGENYVDFKLLDNDGHVVEYASWNEGISVIMLRGEDKSKSYFVNDELFSHLRIIEFKDVDGYDEPIYGISLCTELINDK